MEFGVVNDSALLAHQSLTAIIVIQLVFESRATPTFEHRRSIHTPIAAGNVRQTTVAALATVALAKVNRWVADIDYWQRRGKTQRLPYRIKMNHPCRVNLACHSCVPVRCIYRFNQIHHSS